MLLCLCLGFSSCNALQELFAPPTRKRLEPKEENLGPVAGDRVWDADQQRWVKREGAPETDQTDRAPARRDLPPPPGLPARPEVVVIDPADRPGLPGPIAAEAIDLPEPARRRVALVLPFLGSSFNPELPIVPTNSTWALHFYAGASLAIDSLEQDGVQLDLEVLDSEGSEARIEQLTARPSVLDSCDLIIGPYRRSLARQLADYARERRIPLVSPYSAAEDITVANGYYVQVSPPLATHLFELAEHALERADSGEVVLVARDLPAEKQRLASYQEAHFFRQGTRSGPALAEFIVSDPSADLKDLDLDPIIRRGGTTVIMLPSTDETFVYSFLRKLDLSRSPDDSIRVYGLPQWIHFDYIDPQYLQRLNVHISSNHFVDRSDPAVRRFEKRFLDAFGTFPQPEAYLGFDVTLYFGRMAYYFGRDLPRGIVGRPEAMLHTEFDVEPVINPTTTGAEGLPVERYENKFLHILQYQDYGFLPADFRSPQ